ncbi:enoyl-CoA hydratase-related protein [Nonomuraea cavernae]|uniref:Enoyl-CoA hydratase n=1 Tax=Nonomuraea cavernae TaxID=2045107 RepID=A0A917ZFT2_9ACTN|nr:enoyl-CoA hydratase-related protein [Nonomuraea cavernae]MCA2190772.1 enoyl-CoA hydratase/isomerase family protein [Nonomuraea cavernae]GGO82383.1 enoyl-CoA hydratase [Nonomuraea cavernae]
MAFSEIEYAVTDRIATVTLKRPDRLNAFTLTMRAELIEAFDLADADDDVRAVVVTGAGRAFCAGADLGGGGGTFTRRDRGDHQEELVDGYPRDGGGTVALRIAQSLKPVIGAINGAAVGVGVTMTLPMDVRLAADTAKFGFVFARRGIVPEAASGWFLPRIVGIAQAMEWAATGRVFPASEALEARLVSRLYPADELLPAAYALAREIAGNTSAVSVAAVRRLMWSGLSASSPWEAHAADSRLMAELGSSADAVEGVTSFLEKRPAEFPMKVSQDLPDGVPSWPDDPYRV